MFKNQYGIISIGRLIELNHGDIWPLQHAANAAFLAALYRDYLDVAGILRWNCGTSFYHTQVLHEFSKSQVYV